MTMTVAIYARYSDEIQNPMSIEDQIAHCRKYAAERGWIVTHVYSDAARTGRTAHRPQFIEMMASARRQEFGIILTEAVNRFSRRVVHSLQSWELLSFSDVKLHTVSEGEQDFLRVMLNALGAQMFSEKVAEHTRRKSGDRPGDRADRAEDIPGGRGRTVRRRHRPRAQR